MASSPATPTGPPRSAAELQSRLPPPGEAPRTSEGDAAVLAVFRVLASGTEVLFIRRAEREGDPWSGHMAFPGGRTSARDPDLRATALRETEEEVGLPADACLRPPSCFTILRPANRPGFRVGVFLGVLRGGEGVPLHPGPEVAETVWARVSSLRAETRRLPHPTREEGWDAPGFPLPQGFVWGFTYRAMTEVLAAFPHTFT